MLHQLRTTASRLWLYIAPQRTLLGAVTGLSYPKTQGFPRCRAVQVSPHAPMPSLAPLSRLASHFEPISSACLCGKCGALPGHPIGGTTRFHTRPGHTGIASCAPFHGRPTSIASLNLVRLFCLIWIGSIGGDFTLPRPTRPHQPY